MVNEFWESRLTDASWEKLLELNIEYEFILIGGWATYLWTKAHKSKDIDIVVDYDTLQSLRTKYKLQKNERMHKYEIKQDMFDIDIYLPFYSKLAIPLEDLERLSTKIEGIRVPKTEVLLLLKQAAEIDRRNTIKGKKDSIDIMTLMLRTSVDIKKYLLLAKKYKLEKYHTELIHVIEKFDEEDIDYLGIDYVQFKKEKKRLLQMIKTQVK